MKWSYTKCQNISKQSGKMDHNMDFRLWFKLLHLGKIVRVEFEVLF